MSEVTRRSVLLAGIGATGLWAASEKGASFPSDATRYPDPLTSIDVYRLTNPEYSTTMTAYYNRGIARNSAWMLCCCDRTGTPQAFRLDLKTGEMKQLTQNEDLDGTTLTLTPDNRNFCFASGRSIWMAPTVGAVREREVYRIADGWERVGSLSVGPDGTHVTLVEKKDETSRLRMIALAGPAGARTVIEVQGGMSDPIPRPMRAQILYRQAPDSIWMVNMDGTQNRRLKLAAGGVGTPNWSTDGRTILYLNFPEDKTQLNNLREFTPDTGTDKMIGKTSQFASFGANRDGSVFVGASRNVSPAVLLFVRAAHSERTLCEHKSRAEWVSPVFSPDSQRIYFQSDRHGKPAIYCMHVEKLVEKTEAAG